MPTARQSITSSITRRYPFLSGCGTFANSRLVKLAAGDSEGLAWARLDCGAEILVPLNDYVGRAAYFVGDLDRKISEVIKRIVRPGDHVLDIGANLGVVTMQLAKLVGPEGFVHSFEPNPSVAELLARSIEKSDFTKNVRIHTCALGAEEGILNLTYPDNNAGQGTLNQVSSIEGWNSIQIPVKPLSALAEEFGIRRIRLVKIDVEGHEIEVLRGALSWLSAYPPDTLIFESNGKFEGGDLDPVISLLAERGYSLYSIQKQLLNLKLTHYNLGESKGTDSHDMLAVKKHIEQEIIGR